MQCRAAAGVAVGWESSNRHVQRSEARAACACARRPLMSGGHSCKWRVVPKKHVLGLTATCWPCRIWKCAGRGHLPPVSRDAGVDLALRPAW